MHFLLCQNSNGVIYDDDFDDLAPDSDYEKIIMKNICMLLTDIS